MSDAYRNALRALARDAVSQVALRARDNLRSMPAELSGEDSGLKNVWEEFCVQVRGEESAFWDEYVLTAKQSIEGALFAVESHFKEAMWLLSDAGAEWADDDEPDPPDPPVSEDDVVDVIYDRVWHLADEDDSPRVGRFLNAWNDDDALEESDDEEPGEDDDAAKYKD